VEKLELSYIVAAKIKWNSHFGNSLEVSKMVET
jgi:hypothetical protein